MEQGFFHMGGYAAYVWSSYGVSAAALLALTLWSWGRYAQIKAKLAKLEQK